MAVVLVARLRPAKNVLMTRLVEDTLNLIDEIVHKSVARTSARLL